MHLSYPDPPLADELVRLRPWDERDVDCVREAGSNARIPAGTTVPAVFSAPEGLAFISRQRRRLEDGDGVSLAITDGTDRALGLLWLPRRPQQRVVGLGYWLIPSARGRGLGTHAVRLASEWALRVAGAARVEAWVELDNTSSQKLLAAAGFTREGVLRGFLSLGERQVDVVVFSRTAPDLDSDHDDDPAVAGSTRVRASGRSEHGP